METHITVNEMIKLCNEKGVSLDTPIVIGDVNNWEKPLLYSFYVDLKTYEGTETRHEIEISIVTDD